MSEPMQNLPVLDEWVNVTEAAEIAGISRQHSYRKVRLTNDGKTGGWASAHQIGSKPFYVVSRAEAEQERYRQS